MLMKKVYIFLQVAFISLLLFNCSNDDENLLSKRVPKEELFAVESKPLTRANANKYLFTIENIKSFNLKTREIVFVDFEPKTELFPIYHNIEIHSYNKVLLHIATFVSSYDSQIFTDLSLVSENNKFYLSNCYPRNLENNDKYVKENLGIKNSIYKRREEWKEFLSIIKKHGKLIE